MARIWARREFRSEEEHAQRENQAQSHLEEQFAVLNVQPEEPVDIREPLQPFYLFRENVDAWQLFLSVQSQWRVGMSRTGLDYPGVLCVIEQRRAWRKRRRMLFACVQVMERAALDEWRIAADNAKGAR